MQQDNQALNTAVSADQVCDFLRSHPHFFEQHASLLTEIYLPSPHGSGAISLAERQQLAQRDKIRVTEVMLAQLIEFGEQNDITSNKVHHFSIKLIANQSFDLLQKLITDSMQQDFSVTQSLLRIWLKPNDSVIAQDAIFTPVSDAFSDWIIALNDPYCGEKPALADDLLAPDQQSFAYIPLHKIVDKTPAFGVLILGSTDQQRFKADSGKMFLKRIGELVSAELVNYL
jgi:uncharacterized protein YigA (DUF484 family)